MICISGGNTIEGEVSLNGAKNSALPILVAACLCSEKVTLRNIPVDLNDVKVLISVLRQLGYVIEINNSTVTFLTPNKTITPNVPEEASKIRYSLLLLPLLLSKIGCVNNPMPGGCNLGDRKYDIHIDSLRKMGAYICENNEKIIGELKGRFIGCELNFHTATTSGSESVIIASVLAEGKTIIKNANTRPEVIDLINFLNKMGAKIKYKTRYIEVEGVESLQGGEYEIINDSHEGVSYMILAAMTRGEIKIKDFNSMYIKEDIDLLKRIGVNIFEWQSDLYISAKNKKLSPFSMATSPYPGINSDMQPLFSALASTIEGESIITDTRFTERFQYVNEFVKMGIEIANYQNCAIIQGGKLIHGTNVYATDLRAGASLTFLGLVADGDTYIENFYQVERGYVDIIDKLKKLNANIVKK